MNSTANGTTLSHPTNSRREAVISRHALTGQRVTLESNGHTFAEITDERLKGAS
jgi:hypothetical protein